MTRDEPTPDELTAEWQAIDGRRRQSAGPLFKSVRQMFRAQAERAEKMIEDGNYVVPDAILGRQEPPQGQTALTAENVLPLGDLVEDMKEVFEDHAADIIRQGFEVAVERLEAETNFNPDDPEVQRALRVLQDQARGIGKTTQRELNKTISEGIAENEGVEAIKGRVGSRLRRMADADKDPDTDVQQGRARRIASTSTTTAFEKGQTRAFEKTGMYGRMWLSQRDIHVRRGHLEADGQTVRLNDTFSVAPDLSSPEEELEHPGDPEGSAANVVNCRCTALPIPDKQTFDEMQSEEPDLSNLPQL